MPRKSLEVSIEPKVLIWARESMGLSTTDISKRLGVSQDSINKWESAQKKPTIKTLEKLANIYKRPLAVFFLPSPPIEPPLPKDFRCLPMERKPTLSSKTRMAIRRARRLQSLVSELAKSLNREIAPAIMKVNLSEDPETTAKKIREQTEIEIQAQLKWKNENEALYKWRELVEKFGVLVFQMGMSLEEIRGFSLTEGVLPVIVLNSRDSITARIFSLFHEYVHLLLGKSGICNMKEAEDVSDENRLTEIFCNHFAGALLVPKEDLLKHKLVNSMSSFPERFDEFLYKLAKEFKVSREVILRRMTILGLVTKNFYKKKREEWETKEWQQKKGPFGVDPAKKCIRETGVPFVSFVLQAYRQEKITYSDVADYLAIRTKYLPKVEKLIGQKV